MSRCAQFLLIAFAILGLVSTHALSAAEQGRIAVFVPVLVSQDGLPHALVMEGLREQLERDGYAPVFEVDLLKGDTARATGAVRRHSSRAKLLVTLGTMATQTAMREAPETSIVSTLILNGGEISEHARATGVVLEYPTEIELRWMRHILPSTRRVGVLFNPSQNQQRVEKATLQARNLGMVINARSVTHPREIPDSLSGLVAHADVLWGISDNTVLTPQTAQSLLLFSFRNQIPFIGLSRSWVKAGALYALERDYQDIGRQLGEQVGQVLRGVAPATIPVQTPRKVGVILNLKTAHHLKIAFPADILQAALDVVD